MQSFVDSVVRTDPPESSRVQTAFRLLLGGSLVLAGVGHLTWARTDFRAQVPGWVPISEDVVVIASGVVEVALGSSLVLLVRRRAVVGWVAAAFFVAVFPGNIGQFTEGVDAFGLDTDVKRGVRLVFQPVLVAWALWSTTAWAAWRRSRMGSMPPAA